MAISLMTEKYETNVPKSGTQKQNACTGNRVGQEKISAIQKPSTTPSA